MRLKLAMAASEGRQMAGLSDFDPEALERSAAGVPKALMSLRLDSDVRAFFRGQGAGYQTRINAVLRHVMQKTQAGGRTRG